MEKNGLSRLVLSALEDNNIKLNIAEQTTTLKDYNNSVLAISNAIKVVGESKNIKEIIDCERILIANDMNKLTDEPKDKGTRTSLETASRDLERADIMVNDVTNKKEYKAYERKVSLQDRDRTNGLPRDAFHTFIKSNITRLQNSIISPSSSGADKDVLIARYNNMKTSLNEYIKLQAKALDVTIVEKSKSKSKGLER